VSGTNPVGIGGLRQKGIAKSWYNVLA
jgi:hypothetical protein